jgi:hypothetical protein
MTDIQTLPVDPMQQDLDDIYANLQEEDIEDDTKEIKEDEDNNKSATSTSFSPAEFLRTHKFVMPFEIDVLPNNHFIRNEWISIALLIVYGVHTTAIENKDSQSFNVLKSFLYGKNNWSDFWFDYGPKLLTFFRQTSKQQLEQWYRSLNFLTEVMMFLENKFFYMNVWLILLFIMGILPLSSYDFGNWKFILPLYFLLWFCSSTPSPSSTSEQDEKVLLNRHPKLLRYIGLSLNDIQTNIISFLYALQLHNSALNSNTIFTYLFVKNWWNLTNRHSTTLMTYLLQTCLFMSFFFPKLSIFLYVLRTVISFLFLFDRKFFFQNQCTKAGIHIVLSFLGLCFFAGNRWDAELSTEFFIIFWMGDILCQSFLVYDEFYDDPKTISAEEQKDDYGRLPWIDFGLLRCHKFSLLKIYSNILAVIPVLGSCQVLLTEFGIPFWWMLLFLKYTSPFLLFLYYVFVITVQGYQVYLLQNNNSV